MRYGDLIATPLGARHGLANPGPDPLAWLVIEDRRSGRLPAGSEITSSYLQAIRDTEGFALFTATAVLLAVTELGGAVAGVLYAVRRAPRSPRFVA